MEIAVCADGETPSGATFRGIGDLPGGRTESGAIAVSADGRVVTGWSSTPKGNRAFRWIEGRMEELAGEGVSPNVGHALSADGSVVTGIGEGGGGTVGFVWRLGKATALPAPQDSTGYTNAWGVSSDGSVIAGTASTKEGVAAAVWTAGGGRYLPVPNQEGGWSAATAVSGDGTVIAGFRGSERGVEGAMWRDGSYASLGDLPGGAIQSEVRAVSSDGRIIVGAGGSAYGIEASRFRDGRLAGLGGITRVHEFVSTARGVSSDGAVIVGDGIDDRDQPQAIVWDDAHGARVLRILLTSEFGVDLGTWRLESATGVAADGRTVVGCGTNPQGQPEGWVVTLPADWWLDSRRTYRGAADGGAAFESVRLGRGIGVYDGLDEPVGAAIGADGTTYVADAGADRIRLFDGKMAGVRSWGAPGSGLGFSNPRDVCVSEDGTVLVADSGQYRVQAIRPDGTLVRYWGRRGTGPGQFQRPSGIAARSGRVYVADTGNDRVQVFDERGAWLMSVGEFGHGEGQLDGPTDVSVDRNGRIFIADRGNDRVGVFDREGRWLRSWGQRGPTSGLFMSPTGIEWSEQGAHVVDSLNLRVQVFDENGGLKYVWGQPTLRPHEAGGRVNFPARIAVSPDSTRAAVCEPIERRCQLYDMIVDGRTSSPLPGDSKASSGIPSAIHAGGGWLFVVEEGSDAVSAYRRTEYDPFLVTSIGTSGRGPGQLRDPRGIGFDGETSRLFVSDRGNRRIQVFELSAEALSSTVFVPNAARLLKTRDFPGRWGAAGRPGAMAMGKGGVWAVIDEGSDDVVLMDRELRVIGRIGGGFDEDSERGLIHPIDAAFDASGEELLVLDEGRGEVVVYDVGGNYIRSWNAHQSIDGARNRPGGIGTDADGFVYVTDRAADRVSKFNAEGRLTHTWGGGGIGAGEFFKPGPIAVDPEGKVYVGDSGNRRIQRFTKDGGFERAFGSPLTIYPTWTVPDERR